MLMKQTELVSSLLVDKMPIYGCHDFVDTYKQRAVSCALRNALLCSYLDAGRSGGSCEGSQNPAEPRSLLNF